MIPIENEKRIDWNAIRAEYIGGGTSYRRLAEKYNVSFMVLKTRAKKESWPELRTQAEHKANTEATRRTAEAAADNAAIAARIKHKMLLRLERELDALPELIGSEMHLDTLNYEYNGNKVKKRSDGGKKYRLADFAKAYKDLTDDMPKEKGGVDDPLMELFRRMDKDVQP